jgi:hypothetical protein
MPFAALAFAFLVLSSPSAPAFAGEPSKQTLMPQTSGSLMLAFDDEAYGDRDDDDSVSPNDRDDRYGDDDDEDDSAHGPDDEDDGWDIDPYQRSERA